MKLVQDHLSQSGASRNHLLHFGKKPGDTIRIGATILTCDIPSAIGNDTAIRQIQEEMQEGKGYNTILREIVDDIDKKADGPE